MNLQNLTTSPLTQNQDRLVRLQQIVGRDGLIPVSKSTWWNGVKDGIYPEPVKIGKSAVAWRLSDLNRLIQDGIQHTNRGRFDG